MEDLMKFLKGLFEYLVDFLEDILEFFSGFFSSLGQLLVDSFFWSFTKLSELLADSVLKLVTLCLESFGVENTLWVTEIYETMNFFVPLNELFSVLLMCMVFWMQVFVVKIVLKAIPTIY